MLSLRSLLRRLFMLGALLLLVAAGAARANSTQGAWTALNPWPWFPIHIHLLPTGKVMAWGGDGGPVDTSPRLFDPVTQELVVASNAGFDMFCSGHAFLADGRLFVAGGHIENNVGLSRASVYDPATRTWTRAPDMNAGRWYPTVTTLGNGDALVVSGDIDTTVGANPLPQVFQAATNTWRNLGGAQLLQELYPMMFLAPNGRVIEVGPSRVTRSLDTSGSGAWSEIAVRAVHRGYGSAVMYADGKVLLLGGGQPMPTNTAEVMDLNQANPSWRPVGSMNFARRQVNATVLPDGKVLVTGGTSGEGFNNPDFPVYAAELWDPATETFTTMASASVKRLYHSAALLLPDGRVLTTGGNGMNTPEIFSPPYLFQGGVRPTISSAPAAVRWGQSFTVQTPQAGSVRKVTLIRLGSVTHSFDQNQRLNVLPFRPSSAPDAIEVTAPANGNLAPPGHYMLFVVNDVGVPSVARIVQVGDVPSTPPPTAPAAALGSLAPAATTAGGAGFTLSVSGSGFVSGATVNWNGAPRTTTFVGATQLSAQIPASDIASAGTASVTVVNPGAAPSNAASFTVSAAPSSGCTAPLWVQGRQYAAGSIVSYGGTLYIAKFANPGYNPTISTYYWAPYQCGSTPPPTAPAPAIGSLSPASATAGGPAFTLAVNGSNFVSGAAVRWNGAARTTTFVSATQLSAAIPASDIASAATAQVSVLNPNGAVSGAATFTVTAAPSGSCTAPLWVMGQPYAAGAIVSYGGSLYIAKFANPGYNPTISTYYWAPYQCSGSPPPTTCSGPAWVQGRQYAAGSIVGYGGRLYIAKFANPGYNPTISTYYWAPYAC